MKAVVSIGHVQFLFPDAAGAAKVLELFSKSVACDARLYSNKLTIRSEMPQLGLEMVSPQVEIVVKRDDGTEEIVRDIPATKRRITRGQLTLKG